MGLWRSIKTRGELTWIKYSYLIPEGMIRWLDRRFFPPGSAKPKALVIDIIGSCNLRCPSCPVGNMGPLNESGLMPVETFRKIVDKAFDEYGARGVSLFNWTEPLLHPQLAEIVRIVKAKGMHCMLSSNLNVMRNIDEVLKAGPDWFRISLSGFTQETYGRTHKHGQIERVKENMRLLSEAKKRVGAKRTTVRVYYHKYRHNLHEVEPMRRFSEELGFSWEESWAYYMPLEKVLQLMEGTLPAEERKFVDETFALPIVEAVEAAKEYPNLTRCTLLEDQLVLNVKGEMALCCAVYDLSNPNKLGNFLEMSPEDVKRAKTGHPTCEQCAKHKVFVHGTYHDNPKLVETYEHLVARNLERPIPVGGLSLPVVNG